MNNFLEYSQRTQSNIIPKESFSALVHETFGTIAENMAKSLGPLGSSTTILEGMMTSATKDGFSILKSMSFKNRYKNMIYNLIMRPCTRLNNTVGDGTTTAVVLTNLLFEEYHGKYLPVRIPPEEEGGEEKIGLQFYPGKSVALEELYRLPRQFTRAWDNMIERLTEKIQSYSTPLDPEDSETIYKLAYVTSNGNEEISRNFAEAYKEAKAPVIKRKDSPTNKSYTKAIKGFEIGANLIDQGYVRNEDLSVEEKNLVVMVFDYKIGTETFSSLLHPLNEIFKSKGQKLLILAPYYDAYLANTTLHQYMNQEYQKYKQLNLILAQYNIKNMANKYQLGDLATILRAKVITEDMGKALVESFNTSKDQFDFVQTLFKPDTILPEGDDPTQVNDLQGAIGRCESAILSCTNGTIFRVKDIENDDRYQDMLRQAELELKNKKAEYDEERQSYAYEIAIAQERVTQLSMENYIYYVGAESTLQKNIYDDAVDDVIKCVRSAIRSGTVPGCQISIIRACVELIKDIASEFDNVENLTDEARLNISIVEIIQDAVLKMYATLLHGADGRGMIKLIPLWSKIDNEEGKIELIKLARQKSSEIIAESLEKNEVFDLETLEFSPDIITSTETDVYVLKAASELVKLLISGNQCIYLDSEDNQISDEEVYNINQ